MSAIIYIRKMGDLTLFKKNLLLEEKYSHYYKWYSIKPNQIMNKTYNAKLLSIKLLITIKI